jgi:hypothetical protein
MTQTPTQNERNNFSHLSQDLNLRPLELEASVLPTLQCCLYLSKVKEHATVREIQVRAEIWKLFTKILIVQSKQVKLVSQL